MKFAPTEEHFALAGAIDDIVGDLGGSDLVRQWADGQREAGLTLWAQLSELGLGGLRVPESTGGAGGTPTDLVIVFERLGYHAAPGPYIESLAFLPQLLDAPGLERLVAGAVATACFSPDVPWAVDATISDMAFVVGPDWIAEGQLGDTAQSISPLRTLTILEPRDSRAIEGGIVERAWNEATLASAAYLVGLGERLLSEAVSYAGVREQFGRRIGEFQAIKHQLADVRVALTFARPLVQGASLSIEGPTGPRGVSAAKVAASSAAHLAARVALQIHGAIGYTAEHHVGNWITLVPALSQAWGSPDVHRARIARSLATMEGDPR